MPIGVSLQLFDGAIPQANLTGIQALWWDDAEPKDLDSVTGVSEVVSTDASGYVTLDLSYISKLSVGGYGFLLLYKKNATDTNDSLVFSGRVQTSTITSGDQLHWRKYTPTPWVRPSEWLTLPTLTDSDQKFVGLYSVYDHGSNFVALSASGNYVVNWGDGTSNINVSSEVQAEYNIPYANVAGNTDVGIADAFAVTFTDAGDVVTKTAHGFLNGQKLAFSSITGTTGIATYTNYFVVNKTADTFQVAATQGGTALALTGDGTGQAYIPKYRQVIITVTMQSGQTFTALNLHKKHSQTYLQTYELPWLDIAIAGSSLSSLLIGVNTAGSSTQVVTIRGLKKIALYANSVTNMSYLCYGLNGLRDVSEMNTGAATNLSFAFANCFSLTHALLPNTSSAANMNNMFSSSYSLCVVSDMDTHAVTNMGSMFGSCYSLEEAPKLNTSLVTDMGYMFGTCYNLKKVPLFDTSAVTAMNSMFSSCYSLEEVPLFDTHAVTSMNGMFSSCYSLEEVPLFDTSAVTDMGGMFTYGYSLGEVPLFDTHLVTNMSNMFGYCSSLKTVSQFNTASVTSMSNMFNACSTLKEIPFLDTHAVLNMSNMFNYCYSIEEIPPLDTSAVTDMSYMFSYCTSLKEVPPLNTVACTNFSYMFIGCHSLQRVSAMSASAATASSGYTGMFSYCRSLSELNVTGYKYTFTVGSCKLSGAALDKLYAGLATVTSQTITVSNNWGTASDTPAIATAKGWTVTG